MYKVKYDIGDVKIEAKVYNKLDGSIIVEHVQVIDAVPDVNAIPANCKSWYDGCNRCFARKGKIIGCTRMFCAQKKEAKCLAYLEEPKPKPAPKTVP